MELKYTAVFYSELCQWAGIMENGLKKMLQDAKRSCKKKAPQAI